jgi:hypothetical protein
MFGNPQWFRLKAISFGLIPIRWQGWAYSAAWGSTIALPFWLLTARHQSLEAILWLTLASGALGHDVWKMWRALRQPQQANRPGEARDVRLSCRALD